MRQLIKTMYSWQGWLLLLILVYVVSLSFFAYKLPLDTIFEGDLGRDLYNFYLVSKGNLPYIHFNWIYGFLPPLLYGATFAVFGVSIFNALSLWYCAFFGAVLSTYHLVKHFLNPFYGFLAGVGLILYYEFLVMTFNHVFGTLFITTALLFLYCYIKNKHKSALAFFTTSCLLLAFTKLNMAMAFAFTTFTILLLVAFLKKKENLKDIILAFTGFILITTVVYLIFIALIPEGQLLKSFPYSSSMLMKHKISFIERLFSSFNSLLVFYKLNINYWLKLIYELSNLKVYYLILPVFSLLSGIYLYKTAKITLEEGTFLLVLVFTSLATFHEFILVGTDYSVKVWGTSIIVILFFYTIMLLSKFDIAKKHAKLLTGLLLPFIITIFIVRFAFFMAVGELKTYHFPLPRAQISVYNIEWFISALEQIKYMQQNTKETDMVLSIPYNMFYNFIAKREQPTRYTEFLWLSGLTEKDQEKIIEDIEKHKVETILFAYKGGDISGGVGQFGKTHAQKLNTYIKNNYIIDKSLLYEDETILVSPVGFFKRSTPFKN